MTARERRRDLWLEVAKELDDLDRGQGGSPEWERLFAALEDLRDPGPLSRRLETATDWLCGLPLPGAFRRRMTATGPRRPQGFWSFLATVRSQMPVFRGTFWAGAAAGIVLALVAGLGFLGLTGTTASLVGPAEVALPLVVGGPALVTLTTAYALRSFGRGPWEIEASCPVTPAGMVVGRMVIVLGYVMALAVAATVATWLVAGLGDGISVLCRVVVSWLAPVLLWAALSLYVSLRASPLAGVAVSLGLWAAEVVLLAWRPGLSLLVPPGRGGLPGAGVICAAGAAVLFALALGGAGRWVENAGRTPT